jgi:hypothetical protein
MNRVEDDSTERLLEVSVRDTTTLSVPKKVGPSYI